VCQCNLSFAVIFIIEQWFFLFFCFRILFSFCAVLLCEYVIIDKIAVNGMLFYVVILTCMYMYVCLAHIFAVWRLGISDVLWVLANSWTSVNTISMTQCHLCIFMPLCLNLVSGHHYLSAFEFWNIDPRCQPIADSWYFPSFVAWFFPSLSELFLVAFRY